MIQQTDYPPLPVPSPTAAGADPTAAGADPAVLRRRFEGLLGIPFTEGNDVRVLRNGDEIFPAMLEAVDAAERTVDMLTFIYWTGDIAREFAHRLAARARAGVRVRVLLDAIGARLMDRGLVDHLERCGADVRFYRVPWRISPMKQNHRTHRKVLVCDERVAFTGGVGIAEEWCGDARDESEWRDTHVRLQGPAVDGLTAAFVQNWAETGGRLWAPEDTFPEHPRVDGGSVVQVARGSASLGWNDLSSVFGIAVDSARTHIRMASAYFLPDEAVAAALLRAAARGVDVDVVVPGPHIDKRVSRIAAESCFQRLVEGGVRLHSYQPTMLHAKLTTVDGVLSLVGSANLNHRSFAHDEELVLSVLDRRVAAVLDRQIDHDLGRSEEIVPYRWRHRPLHRRALELAGRGLRHWL